MPSPFDCALITGGKSGLGKALAVLLEKQQIKTITTSAREADLTTNQGIQNVKGLIDEHKPDLIINNAGIGFYGPILSLDVNKLRDIIRINIEALFEITYYGAQTLQEQKRSGVILNISSAASLFPYPNFNLYSASKAFVNNFSLALDQELSPHNIRCLCALPGPIKTPFRNRASQNHLKEGEDEKGMDVEKAAQILWKQIEQKKPFVIFDSKTKWAVWISRLLPKQLIYLILKKSIAKRHPFKS